MTIECIFSKYLEQIKPKVIEQINREREKLNSTPEDNVIPINLKKIEAAKQPQ